LLHHNAATWILQNEPWDFLAVYYNGIDHFCHGFMHYHPPRMEGIPEEKFEIYKDVVNGAYRFHDMMLQTLLDLAGPRQLSSSFRTMGFIPITCAPAAFRWSRLAPPCSTASSAWSA